MSGKFEFNVYGQMREEQKGGIEKGRGEGGVFNWH